MNIPLNYYVENNIRYVFIDGNTCNSLEQCYTTLQQQLSIPNYFGKNLDALEEVLNDLDWIAEQKIRVIILNVSQLLKNELGRKSDFINIFISCRNKKLEIIYAAQ